MLTLFTRSEEREIERLSDDRVSTNEAILPPMQAGYYSPRQASPATFASRKEGKKVKHDFPDLHRKYAR